MSGSDYDCVIKVHFLDKFTNRIGTHESIVRF